jgi:hypothetical protein
MKNKTKWTGFLARITITLETKAILEKTEKKNHSYFTKSPLSFALMIKNIYTFFFYPSSRKQMVRADTCQAKKRLKPTRVRGPIGPIRNPARIARLEEGV